MLPHVVLLTGFLHHVYAFSIPRLPHLHGFVGASHTQTQQQPLQNTLDAWIKREERIALDKLLANVAPGGSNTQGKGVADGTVIASPSQDGPDYWFQCEFHPTCAYH
jgi:glucoamylase